MVVAAAAFVIDVKNKAKPRWLTFTGSSGAGKTYLARRIYRWVNETRQFSTTTVGGDIAYPHDWVDWPKSALALQQQQNPDDVYHAPRTQFLVLDELGGIRDSSGFVSNRLAVILGQRVGKWTVITSNLTVEQVSDRLDTRIASRLIRDGNVVVEVDVKDFALR